MYIYNGIYTMQSLLENFRDISFNGDPNRLQLKLYH